MEVKVRKRMPELTGAERNNESILTQVSLSDHHPQVQRNTNTWIERRFESCHLHKTEREEEIIDLLEQGHRYSKGITNRKRKCLYHTVGVSRW